MQHLDQISGEGKALHPVCVETANAYYQLPNTLLFLVVIHLQQPDALVNVKQMSCLTFIAEKLKNKKEAKFSAVESIHRNNLKETVFLTGQSIKN